MTTRLRAFLSVMLPQQPRWLVLLEALVLVIGIGWFDHATGWEWNFSAPYAVPLVMVAWKAGWRMGFLFSSLCTLMIWASHVHENPYHTAWAFALAVICWWFYFSVLVVAVAILKSQCDLDQAQITALENAQRLEREILDASELEQQRIGRDLHDGLGPHLAAIGYAATFLENELRQRELPETSQALKIREMAGSAALLAQNLARGLFIVPMEGPGLSIALEEMARSTSSVTPMPVSFLETGEPHVEDPLVGIHIYRIACEAVNNSVKHSAARNVTIALIQKDSSLRLTVADDGSGMDPATNGTLGMGLHSMRSRAHALGGEFILESSPGDGTIISCEIPNLPKPADLPS
jgi:signal transduction histidine kinase